MTILLFMKTITAECVMILDCRMIFGAREQKYIKLVICFDKQTNHFPLLLVVFVELFTSSRIISRSYRFFIRGAVQRDVILRFA